jgi:hypothetical protein
MQCPTFIVRINNEDFALNYVFFDADDTKLKISIIKQFEESNQDKHGKQLELDL